MDRKDIEETVIAALRQSGLNPHRAAVSAGLPEDAIRNVLAGHEPKASRLAQICTALGLEFYIGPRRAEVTKALSSTTLRDLEAGAHALVRIVTEAGGNPIPDDLWPALAARHETRAGDERLTRRSTCRRHDGDPTADRVRQCADKSDSNTSSSATTSQVVHLTLS